MNKVLYAISITSVMLCCLFVASCTQEEHFNTNPASASPSKVQQGTLPKQAPVLIDNYDSLFAISSSDGLAKAAGINLSYHNLAMLPANSTYMINFASIPSNMTQAEIENAIAMALSYWSSICNISFRKVSSGANLAFNFQNHHPSVCSAGGSGGYGNATFYLYNTCGATPKPNFATANDILLCVLHEVGHNMGLRDMRHNGGQNPDGIYGTCFDQTTNLWYVNPGYVWNTPPSPECCYDGIHYCPWGTIDQSTPGDPTYFAWRKSYWSSPYGVNKDTHLSIMDYDCWDPNGWWGHTPQLSYLSQYDISIVQVSTRYSVPSGANGYRPLICMVLDKGPDGVTNYGTSGYATNSWDDATSKCHEFKGNTDITMMYGITSYMQTNNTAALYRYYNSTTHDYMLSTASAVSGYTKDISVGNIWKTRINVTLTIGTLTKSHPTIPLFQYYCTATKKTSVATDDIVPQTGWTKMTLGYIVPWTELLKP